MKKKSMIVWFLSSLVYITLLCAIFGGVIYTQAKKNFYEKTAQLIGAGVNDNSDIEQALVSALKKKNSTDINKGRKVLEKYSYVEDFKSNFNNYQMFNKIVISILLLIALLFFYFVGSLVILNIIKRRRIHNLAEYIYNINQGIYKMQIEKKEDEFSILEDELYKTVMMLRESREKERKEKEKLCNNLADISHQLKTPLTSMSLMVELLESSYIEGEESLYIESISAQIQRLNYLVSSLLIISKIDADAMILEYASINVDELVHVAVEPLHLMIEKKNQQLFIKDNSDIFFTGDFHWINEAILNIVKNCSEHTPNGGEISIDYKQTPICTQITIEDNGTGFHKKDIPNIFTRFYKGVNSSKDSVGIGLAVANSIIKNKMVKLLL
ncbi:HAMP domain-containing sensor histidine kinase [Clostridium sp. Marseille-Q2269]|uniref:sensor histidine kinase n=1 Tax=Clostridium sp. Marseille-Q2269 TaxID=2942205 RepID=UPI002074736C|nr:HAMP domain-containing sensor histidine kinase [Clostridium sp. Marseille-Q2269]